MDKTIYIEKAIAKHNNFYCYENLPQTIISNHYINIICPKHGEFKQIASAHLKGQGCPKCAKNQMLTTEEFIERAMKYNLNHIDLSKANYLGKRKKVIATCLEKDENGNIHGDFEIVANNLMISKVRCPKCKTTHLKGKNKQSKNQKKLDNFKQKFIEKAKKIHQNSDGTPKYIYFNKYYGCNKNVPIKCPIHGIFYQLPSNHIKGHGCPKCAKNKKITLEDFIIKCNDKHNNKYDYSLVQDIENSNSKINAICHNKDEFGLEHGIFSVSVSNHLRGVGCPKCAKNKKLTANDFFQKAKLIHKDNIIYDNTIFIDSKTKVKLICPKHGEFEQLPLLHLKGHGCPKCNFSHMEKNMMAFLDANNIKFTAQKKFEWLFLDKNLSLDFFLDDFNIAIECQGLQHFFSIDFFGGKNSLEKTIQRDKIKLKLCQEHNIKLYYLIPNNIYNNIKTLIESHKTIYNYDNIINDNDDLLKILKL